MMKTRIFILSLFLASISLSQVKYFVTKDGSGNFLNIAQVNSASLNSGDIVAFKGGETFADAILECKKGVTYTSFGNGKAVIGDRATTISKNATVKVDAKNVIIDNLIIIGYKEADNVIKFSQGNITVTDCEIVGGQNFHKKWTFGIYQENHTASGGENVTIQRNKIHGFGGAGICISRPFNVDISYNEIYDLWRTGSTANQGASAITRGALLDENNPADVWDCAYTVNIHHNNIHHFEYAAFPGYSRIIYEYNEIHDNLDERIYFGGVKHGDIGKLWDIGVLGVIFRYNYVHDMYVMGQANYTYDLPTDLQRENGTPNVVSTNNGKGRPVYLNAGDGTYGLHFGDEGGETPEPLLGSQGYGNFWVHNNIFYNCSKGITGRGANYMANGSQAVYDVAKTCYLINNTIINCGISTYATGFFGMVYSHAAGQSPQQTINNIIHFSSTKADFAVRYWEKNSYLGYNIYPNQSGVTTLLPSSGSNYAALLEYSAASSTIIEKEQYLVNHKNIWNDTSVTVFISSLGVNGCFIPDVRLRVGGAAHNTGKAYNLLGDNYTLKSTYWSENHSLGQDPSGRSFAYDILGNFRTTNDIGAVGAADSESMIPNPGLKVILEGSYMNGGMKTELNSSNLFPLHQPYNLSPWNINDTSFVNAIPKNYVDWILVELRDNLINTKYSKPGLLTTDGKVINSDGSPFSFPYILSGQYYVLVRHRNHLSIMSSTKVQLDDYVIINYDFTDSQSKAYGENSMADLGDGKFGMVAGDGNADGVVNVLDYSTVANSILSLGYAQGDMDMNGVMNVLDYSFISKNILIKDNLP